MEIRYEYHDVLANLGLVPPFYPHRDSPWERREHARGFEDLEFAPDPFRR